MLRTNNAITAFQKNSSRTTSSSFFDTWYAVGYGDSDAVYEALAWSGLQQTVEYTLLDQFLQRSYNNLIEYEFTGFEELAIGKKCN